MVTAEATFSPIQSEEPMSKTQDIDLPNAEKFAQLQTQLADRWQSIDAFDRRPRQIVVVPSLSLDQAELMKIKGVHYYEERLLFALIRLRNPETRLVYVTSQPSAPEHCGLLPGAVARDSKFSCARSPRPVLHLRLFPQAPLQKRS